MTISFHKRAFDEYQQWAAENRKVFVRINNLIKEIGRTPFVGTGKPEPLKHDFAGYWSRRITDEHRLVYTVENDTVIILSCKYHYPRN